MPRSVRGDEVIRIVLLLDLTVFAQRVGPETQNRLLLNARIVDVEWQFTARLRRSFRSNHAALEKSGVGQSANGGDTAVAVAGPEETFRLVLDPQRATTRSFGGFQLRRSDRAEAQGLL